MATSKAGASTHVLSRADFISLLHNIFINENADYQIPYNVDVNYEKIRLLCNRYLIHEEQIAIDEMVYCHRDMDDLLTFLVINVIGMGLINRSVKSVDKLILGNVDHMLAPFSNYLLRKWIPLHKKILTPKEKNVQYTFWSGIRTLIYKDLLLDITNLLKFIRDEFQPILPPPMSAKSVEQMKEEVKNKIHETRSYTKGHKRPLTTTIFKKIIKRKKKSPQERKSTHYMSSSDIGSGPRSYDADEDEEEEEDIEEHTSQSIPNKEPHTRN